MLKAEVTSKDTSNRLGLSVIEDRFLTCENCNKHLVEILVVLKTDLQQKFKAKCPFCKEYTFVLNTVGETIINATDNFVLINVDTEIENNILKHTMEVQCVKT